MLAEKIAEICGGQIRGQNARQSDCDFSLHDFATLQKSASAGVFFVLQTKFLAPNS